MGAVRNLADSNGKGEKTALRQDWLAWEVQTRLDGWNGDLRALKAGVREALCKLGPPLLLSRPLREVCTRAHFITE